jgi:hypothetical protein
MCRPFCDFLHKQILQNGFNKKTFTLYYKMVYQKYFYFTLLIVDNLNLLEFKIVCQLWLVLKMVMYYSGEFRDGSFRGLGLLVMGCFVNGSFRALGYMVMEHCVMGHFVMNCFVF